ncbi:MAG: hypothetical protein GYB68_17220 [Chloroflexi bacterium]|nr:hypothetical protein [Chloroflexota bacterium]
MKVWQVLLLILVLILAAFISLILLARRVAPLSVRYMVRRPPEVHVGWIRLE